MKYLLLVLLLSACGSSSNGDAPIVEPVIVAPTEKDVYIVAGQSNATGCDWSYFEDLTDSKTIILAVGGKGIDYLINDYQNKSHLLNGVSPKAIIFVHGETDATIGSTAYAEQVEEYRLMFGDLPLLISNVGYYSDWRKPDYPDSLFDAITSQVNEEAEINDMWSVVFDDAKSFAQWGMLKDDGVHFNEDGCIMMMDAFAEHVYK